MDSHDAGVVERADAIVQGWLSSEEGAQVRACTLDKIQEPAGPLVLALNIGHVPVKNVAEQLEGASEEVIKDHPGVRVTFVVLKVLYPGWSSVGGESEGGGKKGAGGGKRGAAGSAEPKEKLTAMEGDGVRMYSYDLVNKKGVYMRNSRSDGYTVVQPGMVVSLKVWGSKFMATFKEHGTHRDMLPLTMSLVQLGIKSVGCKAATTGMMLEVKTMCQYLRASPSCRLLKPDVLARSMEESRNQTERFGQEADRSDPEQKNREQGWIRGNLSSTVHVLMVKPTPHNGIFAMGADGGIQLHVAQPLSDVCCKAVDVRYDKRCLGLLVEGGRDERVVEGSEVMVMRTFTSFFERLSQNVLQEWVAKALNLCCMLGAVELVLVVDTYKTKDLAPEETVLDGYARIDVPALIRKLTGASKISLAQAMADAHPAAGIAELIPASAYKHVVIFPKCAGGADGGVDVALDLRLLTKRAGAVVEDDGAPASCADAKGCEPTSTLVHTKAAWTRAHFLHFFLDGKPMLTALVNIGSGGCSVADRMRRALQSSALVHTLADAEFEVVEEVTEEPPAPPPAPAGSPRDKPTAVEPVKKKSKGGNASVSAA